MNLNKFFLIALSIAFITACNDDDTVSLPATEDSFCNTTGTLGTSTNIEIEAMRQAMISFHNSLSEGLLSEASNCLDDERFYLWHNTPGGVNIRDGISYGDLSDAQLVAFKDILQLFLSAEGYQKVYEISELAEGYRMDNGDASVYSPDFYYIDMFGDPENSGSWGFQLDGHHVAINFLVHGDNVSIVPAFLAGEPTTETYNGTSFDIFADERDLALSVYNGLSTSELTSAESTANRALQLGPATNNGSPDPYIGSYDYSGFASGLKFSDMSTATQANVIALMQEYVYNLNTDFADVWWSDISNNIDDTYFVWIDDGGTPSATSLFYYRIYNPYLWVEYNNEDVLGGGTGTEDWNHVHTITRIPNSPATDNGGDYGIFANTINKGPGTLFEHYAHSSHHQTGILHFDYSVNIPVYPYQNHEHPHHHGG